MKLSSKVLEWKLKFTLSFYKCSTSPANCPSKICPGTYRLAGFTSIITSLSWYSNYPYLSPYFSTVAFMRSSWSYVGRVGVMIERWYPFPYLSLICWAVFSTITEPLSMTQTQSESFSASSRWWVVRMMVLFIFLREEKMSQTCILLRGSKPEVGSSNIKISGNPKMAMETDSFRLFPPESSFTFFVLSP